MQFSNDPKMNQDDFVHKHLSAAPSLFHTLRLLSILGHTKGNKEQRSTSNNNVNEESEKKIELWTLPGQSQPGTEK